MPTRMLLTTTNDEVDVYHFDLDRKTTECFAVCWRPITETWLVARIESLKPIEKSKSKKRILNG